MYIRTDSRVFIWHHGLYPNTTVACVIASIVPTLVTGVPSHWLLVLWLNSQRFLGSSLAFSILSIPRPGEHLLMYLFAICVSSLVMHLFQYFAHFRLGHLCHYWIVSSFFLSILDICPLFNCILWIFYLSIFRWPFHFHKSFKELKLSILIKSNLLPFLLFVFFVSHLRSLCLTQCQKGLLYILLEVLLY